MPAGSRTVAFRTSRFAGGFTGTAASRTALFPAALAMTRRTCIPIHHCLPGCRQDFILSAACHVAQTNNASGVRLDTQCDEQLAPPLYKAGHALALVNKQRKRKCRSAHKPPMAVGALRIHAEYGVLPYPARLATNHETRRTAAGRRWCRLQDKTRARHRGRAGRPDARTGRLIGQREVRCRSTGCQRSRKWPPGHVVQPCGFAFAIPSTAGDGPVHQLLGDGIWRQEAQHGVVRRIDQQPFRHGIEHDLLAGESSSTPSIRPNRALPG